MPGTDVSRESMNQSARFAAAILKQIRVLPGGDKRGHRFAGFAVLKAPDMPSVLVEMGFLSNHRDEPILKLTSYRRDLSRRLTKAIVSYLNEYGPRYKWLLALTEACCNLSGDLTK